MAGGATVGPKILDALRDRHLFGGPPAICDLKSWPLIQDQPDDAPSLIERAARSWRGEVLDDLGGAESVLATKRAVLDTALGSKILLDSLDRYLFDLPSQDGLVNRRNRRTLAIVADRMCVADGLARQLQALGLERQEPPAPDLHAYLAARAARQKRQPGRVLPPRRGAEATTEGEPATPAVGPGID